MEPEPKPATDGVVLNAQLSCEVCGHSGAYELGTRVLCGACYQESGSCCAGGDNDDEAC